MNEKAEPCRLFIEQTISDALDAGREDPEEIGREMWDFLTEHFDTEIKARSLAQMVRRKKAKADLAKRETAAQSEGQLVTTVTKPNLTKAERQEIIQAKTKALKKIVIERRIKAESDLRVTYKDPQPIKLEDIHKLVKGWRLSLHDLNDRTYQLIQALEPIEILDPETEEDKLIMDIKENGWPEDLLELLNKIVAEYSLFKGLGDTMDQLNQMLAAYKG